MRFGVCCGVNLAALMRAAGYDYLEVHTLGVFKPEKGDDEVQTELAAVRASVVPAEAANCLFPGDMKMVGPEAATERGLRIVEAACRRAGQVGVRVIVFGSGKARSIPEGVSREQGWAQLVEFARRVGEIAARHGVTIVMEPLNRKETNILNTVTEGAEFVRAVNHPAVRLLVDAYHWAVEGESPEAIVEAGSLLAHAHIATAANRLPPGKEPQDFSSFFRALKEAGYDGRVSIEAKFTDLDAEAPAAFAALKAAAENAGYRF